MPIRPEINGKYADVTKTYVNVGGVYRRVKVIYLGNQGKAVQCWAAEGTPSNPYLINTFAELKEKINQDPGGCFKLTQDLVQPGYDPLPYLPLLPPDVPFTGILDGNSHGISIQLQKDYTEPVMPCSSDGYCGCLFCKNEGIITRTWLKFNWFLTTTADAVCGGGIAGLNTGIIDRTRAWIISSGGLSGKGPTPWGLLVGRNTGTIQNVDRYTVTYNPDGLPRGGVVYKNEGIIRWGVLKWGEETSYYDYKNFGVIAVENCEGASIEGFYLCNKGTIDDVVYVNKGKLDVTARKKGEYGRSYYPALFYGPTDGAMRFWKYSTTMYNTSWPWYEYYNSIY